MPSLPKWLSKQELIGLLILLALVLVLPIAVLEVQRQKNLRSRAEVAGSILMNDGAVTTTSQDVTLKLTAPWPAAPASQSQIPPSVGGEKLFSTAYAVNICTPGPTTESCTAAQEGRTENVACTSEGVCQINYRKCLNGRWTNVCGETNCQVMESVNLQCGATQPPPSPSPSSGAGGSSGGGSSDRCLNFSNYGQPWPRACDGKSLGDQDGSVRRLFCESYDAPSYQWVRDHNRTLGCPGSSPDFYFGEAECNQCTNLPAGGTSGGSSNTTSGGTGETQRPVARVGKTPTAPEQQMNVFPGEVVYLFVLRSASDASLLGATDLGNCTREFTGPSGYRMSTTDFQGNGNPTQATNVQALGDYELKVTCSGQTQTAKVTVVEQTGGGGGAGGTGGLARLTQSFKVANSEAELASASWQNYTNHPMTIQHRLTDGAGRKTVFVQFRATDGTTSDISSSSIAYAPTGTSVNTSAVACFAPTSDAGNTLWMVQVQGQNFGSTQGTLVLGSGGSAKSLTVTKWENGVVEGTISRTQMPTTTQTLTVTTNAGQSTTIEVNPATCGQTGPVTLHVKASLQDKPDNNHGGNFRVVIVKKDDRKEQVRGQRRFRNSGEMEQSLGSLAGGMRYVAWLKAPGHLAQTKEFVPTPGDYTLDFGTLTTGDIQEDNQVNVQDYSRLVSEWSKSGDVKSSDADLNVDLRVNTIDYAILLKNFSKDGDGEPVVSQ